jgi:hypothetical protein
MIYVRKHPDSFTLANCVAATPDSIMPDGYEAMSIEAFEAWQAAELHAGWQPSAQPEAPAPVPQVITPWQLRKALNQTGLRALVETAVSQADQNTRDGWEFATEFRRDDPMLNAMAAALGMTAEQLDGLFQLASIL